MKDLNMFINQLDVTDIYGTLHRIMQQDRLWIWTRKVVTVKLKHSYHKDYIL